MEEDVLRLRLELATRLGVTSAERASPQRVVVSVSVPVDARTAASREDLADSLDYAHLRTDVLALAKTERRTLERLASDVAQTVLDRYPVPRVTVEARKFPFPDATEIALTITRERQTPRDAPNGARDDGGIRR